MRVLYVHSGNLYGGVETLLRTVARERGAQGRTEVRRARRGGCGTQQPGQDPQHLVAPRRGRDRLADAGFHAIGEILPPAMGAQHHSAVRHRHASLGIFDRYDELRAANADRRGWCLDAIGVVIAASCRETERALRGADHERRW